MYIVREGYFSKIQDEDYHEKHEKRRKSVKHAKGIGTVAGAAMGGVTGASLGSYAGNRGMAIGGAVGAVGGGLLGRHLGKKTKEETEKDVDRRLKRYDAASEKDKKYIRDKEQKDDELAVQRQQALAQQQMAYNSYRW